MHVPGLLIEENGVEILKETANRGSASRPDPITYTYDFPKAEAVAVAQPKNVQGRYVRLSKTGIINLNELYVWKRDGSELVNLAAGKSVTGDSSDHHSGRFSYQNLVNGVCLPKLIHLLPIYGLTYWTVTDRPHPLRRHH